MELAEIETLTEEYAKALRDESNAIVAKADAQKALDDAVVEAYARGRIDGKNAETRKAQEQGVIAECPNGLAILESAETALIAAEIERKRLDMLCSLTKAWLYSQGGRL